MNDDTTSPFHAGERTIQTRLGVRERMEQFGHQVIRNYLPEQHRAFYQQLPFILVGHTDAEGWPWASMLCGEPGFIHSPDPNTLHIAARPSAADPLADRLAPGTRLGVLGIEFHTRRRNRLSAHITHNNLAGIELTVDQTFGNCPQYIQARSLRPRDATPDTDGDYQSLQTLTTAARNLIANADTFFVASSIEDGSGAPSEGVDVSHRGGRPGFVRIDDERTLTIPDYAGNFHFNTLGNFLLNPKAGLLFVDFSSGDILTLTGLADILWDDPDTEHFAGAERLWRLRLSHGRFIRNALPMRWSFESFSPNTALTGTWEDAVARKAANAARDSWRDYQVVRIEDESDSIRSFYLSPAEGALPDFTAGQFLTLRLPVANQPLIRTYTLSSAPADPLFRISVKRESPGQVSDHLHERIRVGDTLQAQAPRGAFTLDAGETRPAVLIAAGVGITPMVSMLRHAMHEAVRRRTLREFVVIHSATEVSERAFFDEINQLVAQTVGTIRYCSVLTRSVESLEPGQDYHRSGRITRDYLQTVLPSGAPDYYLCGPAAFMQSLYDMLLALGVSDARIHAESFGPSALRRVTSDTAETSSSMQEATQAVVNFSTSRFEQAWTPEAGTLLTFAESHGLSPAFGCRSGQCGACKVRLLDGQVSYRHPPQAALADDEVLLCCAVPAQSGDDETTTSQLAIEL